jgi:DNA replication and repair protein RecF
MFGETSSYDPLALETFDTLLSGLGSDIHAKRKEFVSEFKPVFDRYYRLIVDNEDAAVLYNSDLNSASYRDGFKDNRQRDLALQRTCFGIHRDDYLFTLGTGDLKRLGSQGQQKSFVIALKLAQFDILKQHKGFAPLLLLDDIFDKLDDVRISRLLALIKSNELGQLFITDARPDRTIDLLNQIEVSSSVFRVGNGILQQI